MRVNEMHTIGSAPMPSYDLPLGSSKTMEMNPQYGPVTVGGNRNSVRAWSSEQEQRTGSTYLFFRGRSRPYCATCGTAGKGGDLRVGWSKLQTCKADSCCLSSHKVSGSAHKVSRSNFTKGVSARVSTGVHQTENVHHIHANICSPLQLELLELQENVSIVLPERWQHTRQNGVIH
jgi:meiotically up-regulated gene 157 (Mug157) protein